ncbi:MAG: hypothetical protein LQ340_008133, partial [Diploschistes diacapsis]
PPTTHYRQTDVVRHALRRRRLMRGLLALSASHLAALADDDAAIKRGHRERSARFFPGFSAGCEEGRKRDSGAVAKEEEEEEATKAGGRIGLVLLQCARRTVGRPHTRCGRNQAGASGFFFPTAAHHGAPPRPSPVPALRPALRSLGDTAGAEDGANPAEPSAQATRFLQTHNHNSPLDAEPLNASSSSSALGSAKLETACRAMPRRRSSKSRRA